MQLRLFNLPKTESAPMKGILQVSSRKIPFTIYQEPRKNIRVSVVKSGINIRFPDALSLAEFHRQCKNTLWWSHRKIMADDRLAAGEMRRKYEHGSILKVGQEEFKIHLYQTNNKSKFQLVGTDIYVNINGSLETDQNQRLISKLVADGVSQFFLPIIAKRIERWNDQYFQKPIEKIRMRDNSTNWGSCSSKGNISISTRLMFAPERTIDYVIVHELAHMIEYNHSPEFWKVVENVMPDYKIHVEWLKKHARECYF